MMHIREHLDIPLTEIVSITLKFWLKVMGNDVINDEEKEVSIPGEIDPRRDETVGEYSFSDI